MIAPSYQKNYTIKSEPFKKNGKEYVTIKHNRTGNTKDARWYSETEYVKIFSSKKCAPVAAIPNKYKVHDCLGFGGIKDAITIYCGAVAENREYLPLKHSNARYHTCWGWYIPYNEKEPKVNSDITKIHLPWSAVGNADGTLKDDSVVKKNVNEIRINYHAI